MVIQEEQPQVLENNPEITRIAAKWKDTPGSLIMALHEIQNHYGFVPRSVSLQLSKELDVPLARIYEVITFYSYFRLKPPAKHKISVCQGTACYLKGATELMETLFDTLGIKEGEPTDDGLFQVESVRCIGCCGLAPTIMIGEKVYGKVKPEDVSGILAEYR